MLPFLIGAAASVILSEFTKKDKMAIGGVVPTASNGDEFAEGGGVGSLKVNKESDGKYYWTFTFSDGKIEKSFQGFNTSAEAQRDFHYRSKYFAKGGKIERVYIDYLNKEKNFQRDRKYFNSYDEAKKWALKNFDKFNSDMINYDFADGGKIKQVDLFENFDKMPKKLSSIVEKYMETEDYQDTEAFLNEVESIGYTFDYGLDNEPFGLRPIGVKLNQLKGYEEYKKGGKMNRKKK